MKRIVLMALLFCISLVEATGCNPRPTPTDLTPIVNISPPALTPVLEAVLKPGSIRKVVGRNTGGEFEVLPSRSVILLLRAPWPSTIQVQLDGADLEKVDLDAVGRQEELDSKDLGYFSLANITHPSRTDAYWEVVVSPPVSKRKGPEFTMQVRNLSINPNVSGRDKLSDPLAIHIVAEGRKSIVEPSDIFFDDGDNSKPAGSIIAQDVVMAGWIVEPYPLTNPNPCEQPDCEDWHYNILLDIDFMERVYGGSILPLPLSKSTIPGNPANPSRQLSIQDVSPEGISRGITLNSFLLPNQDLGNNYPQLTVELNGWHPSKRSVAPSGWLPDRDHSDTVWPYNPRNPDGMANADGTSRSLTSGDYVIMSGTLWEDGAHKTGWLCINVGSIFCKFTATPDDQQCWDISTGGHGGWIELHPVDSIVRVREPQDPPRKTTAMVAVCVPQELIDTTRTRDVRIEPINPRPSSSHKLKFVELIDGRLTNMENVDEHSVSLVDNPNDAHLDVHLKVHSSGTLSGHGKAGRFKAVYILWWE